MLIILVDFSRLDRFFILDKTLQILFFVLHNVMLYFVRVYLFPDIIFILIFLIKISGICIYLITMSTGLMALILI